jgi:phospholipid/cholesterol/gamma-HCH transport system ATP-binding protein
VGVGVIDVANFSKFYDRKPVLWKFSLRVDPGETVVVIGKSGCGKSTLLKHIARLEDESTGEIEGAIRLFGSIDVTSLSESQARRHGLRGRLVGLVFQHCALFDFLSVRDNILWAALESGRVSREKRDERLREVCAMVEIEPTERFLSQRVDHLSGGERKRVALARALILEPKILLYDEPTANLDPPTVLEITRLINRLKEKNGMTSLVATHDMATAQKIADRMAMISGGVKIFEGTFEEAQKNPEIRKFVEGM